MSYAIDWRVPPSVYRILARAPLDRPVVLLLRHSVRDHLPPGDAGYALPITDVGRRLGLELGAMLGNRLRALHASPLVRCVQTAEALRDGARGEVAIVQDRLLGDPGVFVVDGRRAMAHWADRGHEAVMAHLVSANEALPGMARPDEAARFLVHHMLAASGDEPGVHVFVTHDSLVTATAARLLEQPLGQESWPWYLEGVFFWQTADALQVAYRNFEHTRRPDSLCALVETDVVELARREIAATLGLDTGARFFLAGGAFKTLLAGRPPRDLDVWAPSARDREVLVTALTRRGAHRLPDRPFADAFAIADRVVEIPHNVEPATLEARLARFDLALSAVGVEHRPDDQWRACIHPLARTSRERRQVLLLKPLVNWKYALTTLERMRRYAAELAFAIPAEEEAEIWRVFETQSAEMRAGMMERYARTGTGAWQVAEEAARRLR